MLCNAPSDKAEAIARAALEGRLAACVNIVAGVTSIYRWKGQVEEEGEQLLVIKTVEANVDALRDTLLARHPYEVPEFLVLSVESTSDTYGAWLVESAGK